MYREPTAEERKKYERATKVTYVDGNAGTWKYEPPKEKAIKITVTKGTEDIEGEKREEQEAKREMDVEGETRIADSQDMQIIANDVSTD